MSNQILYREWCSKVNLRKGRMYTIDDILKLEKLRDSGYMSVYMFDKESAEAISKAKSSSGLSKYPVYSNEIMIDIDDGNMGLVRCLSKLDEEGLAYSVYTSGGKGYHVCVALDKMYSGHNIPYSQKNWVISRGIECDESLYQAGRLISMVGRIHPKTGKKKELIRTQEGTPATLQLIDPPTPNFNLETTDDIDRLSLGLSQLYMLTLLQPAPGNRHSSIWKVSKTLSEAGISHSVALELLSLINVRWSNPKDALEVQRAVDQAYSGKKV